MNYEKKGFIIKHIEVSLDSIKVWNKQLQEPPSQQHAGRGNLSQEDTASSEGLWKKHHKAESFNLMSS